MSVAGAEPSGTCDSDAEGLRVIHFAWSGGMGGIERLLLDLTEVQRRMRLCTPTILLGEARTSGAIMITDAAASGPVLQLGLSSGFDLSPRKLRRAYFHFRAHDFIHLHAFNPGVAIAALLSRRPVVYTEHGVLGGANQRGFVAWLKRRLFALFISRCVSAVTCNSHFIKRKLFSIYGKVRNRVDVIYNGTKLGGAPVAASAEAEELSRRLSGAFVVGTFSRLVPEKRIDRLLKAFAMLTETSPLALLVLGDGPSLDGLRRTAEQSGLGARVLFLGARMPVAPFVALMDVCVVPSEGEPFGLAALEALSAGKPTIVFEDGGGLVEIIQPLDANDVVRDEKQLAARLEHYRSHLNSAQPAEARRAHARSFSIERMADETQRLYASLMTSATSV